MSAEDPVGTPSQEDSEPLIRDKWGHLVRPFEATEASAISAMLDRTAELIEVLHDECGVPAFVTYGTLLGAVRDGKLIGHDNDVDVGYLSSHEHPADVARESFRIQRALLGRGWHVERISGGFLQTFTESGDDRLHVDIFACFNALDRFFQVFAVEAPLPRSAIVPLSEVSLEGRSFPAPADPEALLAATYGPDWRLPDPTFRFKVPRATRNRIGAIRGWLGGYHAGRKRWDTTYAEHRPHDHGPSAFARWIDERERDPAAVYDLGCGWGEDAIWLAGRGHRVTGLDYSPIAVEKARERGEGSGVEFELFNVNDLREALSAGARWAHRGDRPAVLCARGVVEHLPDHGRENLWRLASMVLRGGGRMYLELGGDEIDPREAEREISERGGAAERVEGGDGGVRIVAGWR